jgi:hypothetical protein
MISKVGGIVRNTAVIASNSATPPFRGKEEQDYAI